MVWMKGLGEDVGGVRVGAMGGDASLRDGVWDERGSGQVGVDELMGEVADGHGRGRPRGRRWSFSAASSARHLPRPSVTLTVLRRQKCLGRRESGDETWNQSPEIKPKSNSLPLPLERFPFS